jgi:hypothetical protein
MSVPTNVIAVIFGLFACATNAEQTHARDLDAQSRALDLITRSADRICNIVQTEGSSHSEKVTGAVNAQLKGLIGKLADLGISGEGSYGAEDYAGLIREDLPTALKDNAACKTNVFNKLLPVMITEPKSTTSQNDVSCPSIEGNWYSPEYNVILPIRQIGCKISCEYTTTDNSGSTVYYDLTGRAVGDKFEFSEKNTYPNGCIAIFYGRFSAIEELQMMRHIDRTSGQCGVSQTFTQTVTFVRR